MIRLKSKLTLFVTAVFMLFVLFGPKVYAQSFVYEGSTPAALPAAGTIGGFNITGMVLNATQFTPANVQFQAERTGEILLAFDDAPTVAGIKAVNPNCKIYLFTNPYFAMGSEYAAAVASGQAAIDDFFDKYGLKDENGVLIEYTGAVYPELPAGANTLMDVRKLSWQTYFADEVAAMVQNSGVDGVMLDTNTTEPPFFAFPAGGGQPHHLNLASWALSAEELLTRVIAANPGIDIMNNGVSKAPDITGPIVDPALNALVPAVVAETYGLGSDFYDDPADRAHFLNEMVLKDINTLTNVQGKQVTLEVTVETITPDKVSFYLGAVSLIQNGNLSTHLIDNANHGDFLYLPEYRVDFGAPVATTYDTYAPGVYTRDFSNGELVVNATDNDITHPAHPTIPAWSSRFYTDTP